MLVGQWMTSEPKLLRVVHKGVGRAAMMMVRKWQPLGMWVLIRQQLGQTSEHIRELGRVATLVPID